MHLTFDFLSRLSFYYPQCINSGFRGFSCENTLDLVALIWERILSFRDACCWNVASHWFPYQLMDWSSVLTLLSGLLRALETAMYVALFSSYRIISIICVNWLPTAVPLANKCNHLIYWQNIRYLNSDSIHNQCGNYI